MKPYRVFIVLFVLIILLGGITVFLKQTKIVLNDQTFKINEDEKLTFLPIERKNRLCAARLVFDDRPSRGVVSIHEDILIYRPEANYYGTDTFRYHFTCWGRPSNDAKIVVRIEPVNDTPVVDDQTVETLEDESAKLTLVAVDVDYDVVFYRIISPPVHGNLTGNGPDFIYRPEKDFFGTDEFQFQVSDRLTESAIATVKIKIGNVNDPPVISDQFFEGLLGTIIQIPVVAMDSDDEILSLTVLEKPRHGNITGVFPNLVYEPELDFVGEDSATLRVEDGHGLSDTAKITIIVRPLSRLKELERVLNLATPNGGVAIGENGVISISVHPKNYIPASILKLATAAAAIDQLGFDYRFQTIIYLTKERDLYIKGYGDPSLSTGDWRLIIERLVTKKNLTSSIRHIILDDSAFEKNQDFDGRVMGINWFDAPLGPIVSNQNTVKIIVGADRTIRSWRGETPITQTIIKSARGLPRGFQHISIVNTPDEGTRYTGELVREVLSEKGIECTGDIKIATVPPSLKPVIIYESRDNLRDVIKEMLLYSNNFIANQLLLAMALEMYGEPVNLKMGVSLLDTFLRSEVLLKKEEYHVVEGAGLSRMNQINLNAMLKLVWYFQAYKDLVPALRQSKFADLSSLGGHREIIAKTGTLTNVSTVAGYIFSKEKEWIPFVIMLENGQENRAELLDVLAGFYQD